MDEKICEDRSLVDTHINYLISHKRFGFAAGAIEIPTVTSLGCERCRACETYKRVYIVQEPSHERPFAALNAYTYVWAEEE